MCTVCGCNETEHTHDHSHEHEHDHNHSHQHHYGKGDAGLHIAGMSQQKIVQVEMDILSKNNRYANENRAFFLKKGILALNLVSSPGSGKTSILETSLLNLKDEISLKVIEGDQQTTQDADRIQKTGVKAIQVNTGKGCHLDAHMVVVADICRM
jgi:hydrogenase nickel incorporation protein HypB